MRNEWQYTDKGLVKHFKFKSFIHAINFIDKVAQVSESIKHHPDIHLENYNQVRLVIFTHSDQKITTKDHELASKINDIEE